MSPENHYLVMASHLPLKKRTGTFQFFRAVFKVRQQLAHTEGLIGYTLRAQPIKGHYWTLSVWENKKALTTFMQTSPHVEIMSSLKPIMDPTKFVQWQITANDGLPNWPIAFERLASN